MWKRSFCARRPSKSEVEDVKTKLSCEMSLKTWKWKMWKWSFGARLPSKMRWKMWTWSFRAGHPSKSEVEDVTTKLWSEISLKRWGESGRCENKALIPFLWHPFALALSFDIPLLWRFPLTSPSFDIPKVRTTEARLSNFLWWLPLHYCYNYEFNFGHATTTTTSTTTLHHITVHSVVAGDVTAVTTPTITTPTTFRSISGFALPSMLHSDR